MKNSWPALVQQIIAQSIDLRVTHVLLEYDGPQITLATVEGVQHLGVAADECNDGVRWIYSPVTNLELQALASGSQTTRNALLKREVLVVDIDHRDQVTGAWKVPSEEIEEDAFPTVGAVLPMGSRQLISELHPQPTHPEIALEQLSRRSNGIPFKALSQAINVFQRLWTALAAAGEMRARGRYVAGLEDRAMLYFAEASAGSLRIRVEPSDATLYEDVSETFTALVDAGEDSQQVSEVLTQAGPRVQNRYKELLSTLQRNDLEIMAYSRNGAAFLGPERAGRILGAMLNAKDIETTNVYSTGYFLSYSFPERKFEFVDVESDRHFKGDVDADVSARNRAITVGEEAMYSAIIEVATTHLHPNEPEEQYRLRAAVEMDSATATRQPD